MIAAVYARVSSEEQAQKGYSLDYQIDVCTKEAKKMGADHIDTYVDDGVPGEIFDRPALTKLRELVRNRYYDCVIVLDPDRLARKLYLQLLVTDEIEKSGAILKFINMEWKNTPEGRLYYSIKGVFAEYEKAKIADRTLSGRIQKAKQGGMPSAFNTYGYCIKNKKVEIIDSEAEIVRKIFVWFTDDNLGMGEIAARLNDMGIPTKRGGKWRSCTVRYILSNTSYTGVFKARKMNYSGVHYNRYKPKDERVKPVPRDESEWIAVPVPQVVDEETWLRAQERLRHVRRLNQNRSRHEYLLSGLVVCSDCGYSMHGASKTSHGRTYYGYSCYHKELGARRGCQPMKWVSADRIDNAVWKEVKSLLNDPQQIMKRLNNSKTVEAAKTEIGNIDHLLEAVERGQNNILKAISRGLLDLDANTSRELCELKTRKENLLNQRRQLEAAVSRDAVSRADLNKLCQVIEGFDLDSLEFEEKKELLRTLVKSVRLSGRGQNVVVSIDLAAVPAASRFEIATQD